MVLGKGDEVNPLAWSGWSLAGGGKGWAVGGSWGPGRRVVGGSRGRRAVGRRGAPGAEGQVGGRGAVTAVRVPLQVRRRQLHLPLQLGLTSGLRREASGGADGEWDHHQPGQRPELQPRGYLLQVSGAVLWERRPVILPSLPG